MRRLDPWPVAMTRLVAGNVGTSSRGLQHLYPLLSPCSARRLDLGDAYISDRHGRWIWRITP